MNKRDANNLMFLMSLDRKALKQWYIEVTEDDRLYAEELLEQGLALELEARVAKMPQYKEANKVLDKFRL